MPEKEQESSWKTIGINTHEHTLVFGDAIIVSICIYKYQQYLFNGIFNRWRLMLTFLNHYRKTTPQVARSESSLVPRSLSFHPPPFSHPLADKINSDLAQRPLSAVQWPTINCFADVKGFCAKAFDPVFSGKLFICYRKKPTRGVVMFLIKLVGDVRRHFSADPRNLVILSPETRQT